MGLLATATTTVLALTCSIAGVAEPVAVDYLRDIKPILKERCVACHGPLKQEGKLRLDTANSVIRGGESGPSLPSKSGARSPLLTRIADTDPATRMPAEGQPLSSQQVAAIKAWIERGAPAPQNEPPENDPMSHWAFKVPVRPKLPTNVDPRFGSNPVDRFIAVEHAQRGLVPSQATDPATLLRRVCLDLIGLPPTPEQLRAFLADPSPAAYEQVVDRLLASPQYGERWARHWMDVWRYSDWYGRRSVPDNLNSYGQMWRYRDWIVRSLNRDHGYDRMVKEMLAADEICPGDADAAVATGFLLRNFFRWNYNQWMRDNVEHTSKAFLGLTMNCCHCHDHKYDPLRQEDYFRMRAFFEPLQVRHDRVQGEPDPGPFEKYVYARTYKPIESGRASVYDESLDAKTFFYTGGDERNKVPNRPPVSPGVPIAFASRAVEIKPIPLPPQAWYPGVQSLVRDEEIHRRREAVAKAAKAVASSKSPPSRILDLELAAARSDLASLLSRIQADNAVLLSGNKSNDAICATASKAERQHRLDLALLTQAQAEAALTKARSTKAKTVADLETKLKQAVEKVIVARKELEKNSTVYSPIGPTYPKQTSGRRTVLANWIASRDNPLTARVAVNYLWGWHFSRPLVDTTDNFGVNGKRPSHPDLLDWLACEFADGGWKMKSLHRLIVTSRAYRMQSGTSRATAVNHRVDPDNRWLWRFPTQRMESEVVRDSVLAVAGQLDATIGGKEIPHEQGQRSRRRSIYLAHHGESSMQFLEMFDVPSACDAYRRTTSVMPQQALAMSNSELLQSQSRTLASALWSNSAAASSDPESAFIAAAFERILNRPPKTRESTASLRFLESQSHFIREHATKIQAANARLNLPLQDPAHQARIDFVLALFNHNDFLTIR